MKTISLSGVLLCALIVIPIACYCFLSKLRWVHLPQFSANDCLLIIGLSLAFTLVGYNTGLFTGLSLTPVIQYVVPAVLTFVTGFITYIFLKKDVGHIMVKRTSWIVIVFNIGLFTGCLVGMNIRGEYDIDTYNQDLRKELFLKRLEFYIKYKVDTGIQKIKIPFEQKVIKDSTVITINDLRKLKPKN